MCENKTNEQRIEELEEALKWVLQDIEGMQSGISSLEDKNHYDDEQRN